MSSSLGIKLSLPSNIAEKLREGENEKEKVNETSKDKELEVQKAEKGVPRISIDLERLVGYDPEIEEIDSIRNQLLTAMWTRYEEEEREEEDATLERNVPPPDFDFQVVDLLDSGVATFAPSNDESISSKTKRLVLSYPSSIIVSEGKSVETRKIWKESSSCPSIFIGNERTAFLTRLWKYLAFCSRNLDWKNKMSAELSTLVKEEQARLDYGEWTSTQRKAKLDQLYSIRETICHQVEMNKSKYDDLVEDREKLVKKEMEKYQKRPKVGNAELSFPDEFQWLGLQDAPVQEEDDWGLDDDSYMRKDDESFSGNDSSSLDEAYAPDDSLSNGEPDKGDQEQLHETGVPQTLEIMLEHDESRGSIEQGDDKKEEQHGINPQVSEPFRQRKQRMKRAKERKRRKKEEAERRAEQERLEKLQNEIRQKLTVKDLIIAQTMYEALSKKLEHVEELLESLQDEEWQAEEEKEVESIAKQLSDGNRTKHESSFSLLDQILAMILGTTPIKKGMNPKEHYQFIKKEHESIVSEWYDYFGRLPPSVGDASESSKDFQDTPKAEELPSPSELRLQLGITDNADEEWDKMEDLEVFSENTSAESANKAFEKTAEQKPAVVGLRPGGRIAR